MTDVNHKSMSEPAVPDMMPASTSYIRANGDGGISAQASDSLRRHQFQNTPGSSKRAEFNNQLSDPELAELYNRSCRQEEEILHLRKQLTHAFSKELQLLDEKHILERRLSELRIALDEKQDESVASTMKELTKKRSYFEENLRLINDLKVEEEEIYVLTSTLLSLLAEYNIRPPQMRSSTISYGVKQLYQHMNRKLKSYEQMMHDQVRLYDQYPMNTHHKSFGEMVPKGVNFTPNHEMPYPYTNEKSRDLPSDVKEVKNTGVPNSSESYAYEELCGTSNVGEQFYEAPMHDNPESFVLEGEYGIPGIEGFQVHGEAKPGYKLLGCGYPTNGTILCIFQWIRELEDGTNQYIEGASVPEYVVTADDVGTILSVECTPIDDSDQQGDLVRQFANNGNKIACDLEMQNQIDSYISAGKAIFNVKVLVSEDSSNWEYTAVTLKRSTFQIDVKRPDGTLIEEKYSPGLEIKVPLGYTTRFSLTCLDGTNIPLSTDGSSQPYSLEDDVRLRDIIVLTMRCFQSKALDSKRKAKA